MDIGWKWQKRGILLGKLLEKPGCTWKWLQPMVAQPWRLALRLAWPRRGVRQKKGVDVCGSFLTRHALINLALADLHDLGNRCVR
jgi:hypothetical protein